MREPAARLARELLEPLAGRRRMDLLYDFAQPYSIGLICAWLGVPTTAIATSSTGRTRW